MIDETPQRPRKSRRRPISLTVLYTEIPEDQALARFARATEILGRWEARRLAAEAAEKDTKLPADE